MKYAIYGSCVTRDIFSILEVDDQVSEYRARSSIHSYVAPSISADMIPDLSAMSSGFQKRMVVDDFTKPKITNNRANPILVDFIDERFRVLKFEKSYVTESNEFKKVAKHDTRFSVAFERGASEREKFREACKKFSLIHSGTPVVLHKSRYATHAKSQAGVMELEKQEHIENMNEKMAMYEAVFAEEVSLAGVVFVPEIHRWADPNHKWGLAPFHYIREYYEIAYSQILAISTTIFQSDA
jgi:hypothetical protein